MVEIEVNASPDFKSRSIIAFFPSIYLYCATSPTEIFAVFLFNGDYNEKVIKEFPVWDVSHHLLGSKTYLATDLSNRLANLINI